VDLHRIYDRYKDQARFLTVYIAEAHPEDEWQMDSNREQNFVFKQPQTSDQRKELAKILVDRLKYRVPLAIDSMDNRTDKAFAAWPERIYILGEGGKILYKGGPGPFGFKPDEAEKALAGLVTARAPQPAGG
jgi:hypothetical protein